MLNIAKKSAVCRRLIEDTRHRAMTTASLGFAINAAFALYNGVLGAVTGSVVFGMLSAYYIVLSVARFLSVRGGRRKKEDEYFIMELAGALLILLAAVLSGTVYLGITRDTAAHGAITTITLATFTTVKTSAAIVSALKARKTNSPLLITIRNISCADAGASIFSLQRTMFASFGGMQDRVMNAATGIAVCLLVLVLGIGMTAVSKKHRRNKNGNIQTGKGK